MDQNIITIILLSVFLLCALGLILVIIWLYRNSSTSRIQGRINTFVEPQQVIDNQSVQENKVRFSLRNLDQFREWLNDKLSVISSESLQVKISSAYWPMSDTEFILVRITITLLGFAFGWLIPGNILVGIFLAAILWLLPMIILDRSIANRQRKFQNQLLDVLIMIKGAVQAGYSLPQSLDMTVKELHAPSSEEFGRVLREVRFGFPLEQALMNLSERMESDDLQIVITAIIINTQVGGNLSTVLESTIATIRDRVQLFSEIRSLSAYARYVGQFLSLLPFITGLVIFLVTPDYFESVKDSPVTQIILVIALIGILIGNFWIRRIVKIRV